jgi:hypothetical protein
MNEWMQQHPASICGLVLWAISLLWLMPSGKPWKITTGSARCNPGRRWRSVVLPQCRSRRGHTAVRGHVLDFCCHSNFCVQHS